MLPGAHRIVDKRSPRCVVIRWRASRERGAVEFARIEGASLAEAEANERARAGEIAAAYAETRKPLIQRGTVSALIADYKSSEHWRRLRASTQTLWHPHLDHIDRVFGPASLKAIQQTGSRKLIRDWHASMSDRPRTANIALTVLVRVFEHGVDIEDLEKNPAKGLARLDEGEGRAGIVWGVDDLARVLAASPDALARALRLAHLTGLRRADLAALTWAEVDEAARMIRRPTLKSGGKRVARIPITPEIAAVLKSCPRNAVQLLTDGRGKPWQGPGLAKSLRRAMAKAGLTGLHLHDLRGTRASLDIAAGLTDAELEAKFGWAPGNGAEMRGVYGSPEVIALALRDRTAPLKRA
jgi:integrase